MKVITKVPNDMERDEVATSYLKHPDEPGYIKQLSKRVTNALTSTSDGARAYDALTKIGSKYEGMDIKDVDASLKWFDAEDESPKELVANAKRGGPDPNAKQLWEKQIDAGRNEVKKNNAEAKLTTAIAELQQLDASFVEEENKIKNDKKFAASGKRQAKMDAGEQMTNDDAWWTPSMHAKYLENLEKIASAREAIAAQTTKLQSKLDALQGVKHKGAVPAADEHNVVMPTAADASIDHLITPDIETLMRTISDEKAAKKGAIVHGPKATNDPRTRGERAAEEAKDKAAKAKHKKEESKKPKSYLIKAASRREPGL